MTKSSPAIEAFKVWIFPSLVSILAMMIWNDVNEVKADIKILMAQSNIDKTRIDNLERVVYGGAQSAPAVPFSQREPKANEFAIVPENRTKIIKYEF